MNLIWKIKYVCFFYGIIVIVVRKVDRKWNRVIFVNYKIICYFMLKFNFKSYIDMLYREKLKY